jgi:putative colanic acid biosynthesis UDP-glucose lipid carrier transferase
MLPRGMLRQYSGTLSVVARILDAFCILGGAFFAFWWRFGGWEFPIHYQIAVLLALLLAVIFFSSSVIYKSWRGQGWFSQARLITVIWASVLAMLVIVGFATKTSEMFSREWFGVWALTTWGLILFFRFSLNHILRVMRASGFNHKRIVVVGAGDLGARVARNLNSAEWTGLDIVGFFDDKTELIGSKVEGIKVRGPVSRLSRLIRRVRIDEIWLALPLRAEHRVKEILHELRHCTVTVRFVPDIFGLRLLNHSMVEIAGLPLLNISESPMYGFNRVLKFLEDKIIALAILIVISPLMIGIAIGVKMSSPGPIFYRQKRVSWNGKPFMMLKFRSMPVDAETRSGAVWAKSGENRATKFGAFLRRTSLDELPQFIDVLKGNMSIVGPRPERPVFVDKFKDEIPGYMQKHMVKAGITGWAQVNGWRGNTDLGKRIEYDLYYIENWSFWFDLKIIFLTLFRGFVHKNAY